MKKVITIMLLGLLLPFTVYADQIYGSLRRGEGQAIQVSIEVACSGQVYRVVTDNYRKRSRNPALSTSRSSGTELSY